MRGLKSETYQGYRVHFRPLTIRNFRVAAHVPSISSQYLGAGRTKKEAFEEAKQAIDRKQNRAYVGEFKDHRKTHKRLRRR